MSQWKSRWATRRLVAFWARQMSSSWSCLSMRWITMAARDARVVPDQCFFRGYSVSRVAVIVASGPMAL